MLRKKSLIVLAALIVSISILLYAAKKKRIIIEGSTTVLPVAQKAAEVFMKRNPNVDISVRGGGSGVGIASLIEGTCDIANSSRAIKDKEIKKATERGVTPKAHVIAMDGIAVIVHPSNEIDGLTKKQIKDIYTGKISNWAEVGGKKGKIVVISRDTASGTFEAFSKLALDGARVRPDALLLASNRAVHTTVAKTPGAIGYIGLGFATDEVKVIKIDGVDCSEENILAGEYILARPLFMYTIDKPKEIVKKFIDFILSEEGQKLVEEEGFIRVK